MKMMHLGAYLLVIVGALNWGLIGLFNFNLVSALVGSMPMVEKVVYVLVGVSAVAELVTHQKNCMVCSKM